MVKCGCCDLLPFWVFPDLAILSSSPTPTPFPLQHRLAHFDIILILILVMSEEPSPADLLWAHHLSRQLHQVHERTNSLESDQQQTRATLAQIQNFIDSSNDSDVKEAIQNLSQLYQSLYRTVDQKLNALSNNLSQTHEQTEALQSQNDAIKRQNETLLADNASLKNLVIEVRDALRARSTRLPRSRTVSKSPSTPLIPTSPTESCFIASPPKGRDWRVVDRTTPLPPKKTTSRVSRPPGRPFNIVGEPHEISVQERHVYSERSVQSPRRQQHNGKQPAKSFTIIGEPHTGPRERRRPRK